MAMQDEAESEFVAEQKRIFTREATNTIQEEAKGNGQPKSPGKDPDAGPPPTRRPNTRNHRRRASAIEWKPPDKTAIEQRRAKAGLLGSKLHATL